MDARLPQGMSEGGSSVRTVAHEGKDLTLSPQRAADGGVSSVREQIAEVRARLVADIDED